MSEVATRSELLQRRAQITLAQQGRDLIWDKRTALMQEFRRQQVVVLAELDRLAGTAAAARQALEAAGRSEGPTAVTAAALGAATGIDVTVTSRTIAGVRVVDLEPPPVRRSPETRGFAAVLVASSVDAVAEAYERYLERVLALCVLELTVRRLAAEIARATRQVNALENVVVPRLQEQAQTIQTALDEREREEHTRLRRARDRRRPGAPTAATTSAP